MVGTLFFLSGLSSLIYELVWLRITAQVLGNTTYAIGTVIAIFMGGLALGSWGGGLITSRRKDLLRLYGLLEGGIALLAAGLPFLLRASASPLTVLLLLPPTLLMGATFPVLSHFLSRDSGTPSREIGIAYAVNTLGGVLGVLLAAFCLLPLLGIAKTNSLAAALNLAVALTALGLSASPKSLNSPPPPLNLRGGDKERRPGLVIWIGAALSGFAALVYETAWARSLVLSFGSTVYAFGLVLSAFLLGIALGAVLITRAFSRIDNPLLVNARLQILASGLVILLLPFLGDLPAQITEWIRPRQGSLIALFSLQSGLSILFVFLPALFIGTALPLFFRIGIRKGDNRGFFAGGLYAANTVGAIAGSLLASFLLIPKIGLSQTILLAAAVNLGLAILLRGRSRWPSALLLASLWTGGVALLPPWDFKILSSGGYLLYGSPSGTEILDHFWDSYGLVTVHQFADGSRALRINGKTDASTHPLDMTTQTLAGHIPLFTFSGINPPEDVFVLGLGAGGTLSAVERYPVKKITMAEISPGVVKASRYFKEANNDALADPRVDLKIADGRRLLQTRGQAYDVVISEPSNLWVSGMANLFSHEFFETAKERLKPGGVMGQWIHAYALSGEDFKTVIRTFYSVFPHGEVWELFPGNDYLLVGRQFPLSPDRERLRRTFDANIGQDLQFAGIKNFEDLAAFALMDAEGARAFAGLGPLITDDRNLVEYTAPLAILGDQSREIPRQLELFGQLEAIERFPFPEMAAQRRQRERFARALKEISNRNFPEALAELSALAAEKGLYPQLGLILEQASRLTLASARSLRAQNQTEAALKLYRSIPPLSRLYPVAQAEIASLQKYPPSN